MPPVKKCRHRRAEWDECSCAWYLVKRVEGRQVYENLGSDRREAARLARLGEHVDHQGETFRDLGRRWLAMVEPRIRSNTLHNYRHALERATEILGELPVGQITAALVAEMEASLAAAGLAPGTITNIRVVTTGVLRFAEDAGVIDSAPNMRRFKPLARASTVKHLDPPDMERLLATLEPAYARCFTFGWLTGLRPGELLAVEAGDIRGNVLHVARQVNTRTGVVTDVLKTTRSRRRIDLSPRALTAVSEAVEVQITRVNESVSGAVADARLWPFSYSSASQRWHDGLVRCGLPPMGLHALRHSNASLRLAAGQDIVFVCDQLGHSNSSITLRVYAHLIPRPDRDVSSLDRTITQLGGSPSG